MANPVVYKITLVHGFSNCGTRNTIGRRP